MECRKPRATPASPPYTDLTMAVRCFFRPGGVGGRSEERAARARLHARPHLPEFHTELEIRLLRALLHEVRTKSRLPPLHGTLSSECGLRRAALLHEMLGLI